LKNLLSKMCFNGEFHAHLSQSLKGTVHPEMKILSSLLVPNLYEFLSSVEHKRRFVSKSMFSKISSFVFNRRKKCRVGPTWEQV